MSSLTTTGTVRQRGLGQTVNDIHDASREVPLGVGPAVYELTLR
jgi:hypothetical protein